MAHFYANIQGSRGEATRLGTKNSGITGHIRGWNVGARVDCSYSTETNNDIVKVYPTAGSNGGSNFIATWDEATQCLTVTEAKQ